MSSCVLGVPAEYVDKSCFSEFCRFFVLNWPWSLLITQGHFTINMELNAFVTHTRCIHFRVLFSTKSTTDFPMSTFPTGWLLRLIGNIFKTISTGGFNRLQSTQTVSAKPWGQYKIFLWNSTFRWFNVFDTLVNRIFEFI